MTTIRALIRKDPDSGRLVGWVPQLLPEGRCESDDYLALTAELERMVHRIMEQREPGSTLAGVVIETASVI